VLILTGLASPGNLRRALAAHVAGFLPKDTPADDLVTAVRRIAAGGEMFDHELALRALQVPDNPLAPREAEVLRRFAQGAEATEIAAELYLTPGTVRNPGEPRAPRRYAPGALYGPALPARSRRSTPGPHCAAARW
jgi:two-component system response regulator DesR